MKIRLWVLLIVVIMLFTSCVTTEGNIPETVVDTEAKVVVSDNKTAWENGLRGGTRIPWEPDDVSQSKIENYKVYADNKILPRDELTAEEFNKIESIFMSVYARWTSNSTAYDRMSVTIAHFNSVKSISGIKLIETKNRKLAYNIYRYKDKKLCIIYGYRKSTLYFDRALLFEDVQSYDLYTDKNLTLKDVKNINKALYTEELKFVSEICAEFISYIVDIPWSTDSYTSHMTDKGILYIDYDDTDVDIPDEYGEYKIIHRALAKGIYAKLHKSLLADVQQEELYEK